MPQIPETPPLLQPKQEKKPVRIDNDIRRIMQRTLREVIADTLSGHYHASIGPGEISGVSIEYLDGHPDEMSQFIVKFIRSSF